MHDLIVPAAPENGVVTVAYARQADSDDMLIRLWLDGRARNTARVYETDASAMLAAIGKPLSLTTLPDLQAWAGSLAHLAPASRARKIGAIKSMFSFAERIGYLPFNIGAALRLPPVKNTLAERILDEAEVVRLIALENDRRNHAVLRLGYVAGLRISELCGLRWRDAQGRPGGGQITIFGKGGKTRTVLLPASMWRELVDLRGESIDDDPIFRSAKGGQLDPSQVHRIVKAAAARAGLPAAVSAHWLRHAHVSHALDRGAPAHLVQATVGHSDLRVTSRYAHARPNESSASYLIG